MRVLFVVSGLGLGGAERQIVLLARELVECGHAAAIYTLNREIPRADELAGSDIELVVDQKAMRLDLGVIRRLRRHIATWKPDVVHGFLYDGDLYARLGGLGMGVPVLNSERSDNYQLSLLQRLGYRLTAPLADGIVANTHAGAVFAQRLHRLPAERVHVVWNGIDTREVDRRLSSGARPAHDIWPGQNVKRACLVGAIRPEKDYLLALRVARRLVDIDPSWRLICVGDPRPSSGDEYKEQVLAVRERLGLEPYVEFVGHRRDVPEIIGSCDVLLVTSVYEGFPNVVLEAMACGTPVASTNYSDVRRILPMRWQVVESRDQRELADAVLRCRELRSEVAGAQRRWVEEHATVEASTHALLAAYACYARRPAEARERPELPQATPERRE
jgi:glycosyltransferase involved in cell wall biosynthesis